ncbi:MAG: ECF-type sigma factor [Phycisphaerales bacterium]
MQEDATVILERLVRREPNAADALLPLVYDELRALAEKKLRGEPPEATLRPTSLVHEAYLKLVDQTRVDWKGRAHFLGVAATLMRRTVIEHARGRGRRKRGGGWRRITLSDAVAITTKPEVDLLELDEALTRLAAAYPREARVVELRVFAGMTIDETAEAIGISPRAVDEDWAIAKAWLRRELREEGS